MGRKRYEKRRNCSLRAISCFPSMFSEDLNCRLVKIGLVWKRVNSLPNYKFFNWSKLKRFADDKLKMIQMAEYSIDRAENIVGKCYISAFCPFSTMFSKCFFQKVC